MKYILSVIIVLLISSSASLQPSVIKDHNSLMEIPDMVAIASSPAHIYVLSESEGMAVFRTSADTLQWLYTSPNMQRRGDKIRADIRFAYLFSTQNNRFTVLEPTSLLGVYSSTQLPHPPQDAARFDNDVYISLGDHGLIKLSLESPEAVDSEPTMVLANNDTRILSLTSNSEHLFALANNRRLFHFNASNIADGEPEIIQLSEEIQGIRIFDDELFGYDENGRIYRIGADGNALKLFEIEGSINTLDLWGNFFVVRDQQRRIWLGADDGQAHLLRADGESRNLFTVSKNNLWMSEFNQLSLLQLRTDVAGAPVESQTEDTISVDSADETPKLALSRIDDVVLPFPRPLILALSLENPFPADDVRFQARSRLSDIQVRNHGLMWKPRPRDVGHHNITIIATSSDGQVDSTSFHVEVRNFNSPPRFSPVRPLSIPVNEEFELPIRATDPDGMDPHLIRYIGIDLPEGSDINERTGVFTWTPHRRQTGEHQFDVIATDQYGAAASITITINVVSLSRDS